MTFFSTNKLLISLLGLAIVLVTIGIMYLQIKALKAEAKLSELTISQQKLTIDGLVEAQEKLVSTNKRLRAAEQMALKQRQESQRQLKENIRLNGYKAEFDSKMRCLELATGSEPTKQDSTNTSCKYLVDKK